MRKLHEMLLKPEYFYRPMQVWRRVEYSLNAPSNKTERTMPWGSSLAFYPREVIGKSIYTFGLYDLALSEALWRLIDEGDVVLDVGANIGYTTSLMSKKVGATGKVHSFEPHPGNFSLLAENASRSPYKNTELHQCALSTQVGNVELYLPANFTQNQGVATLEKKEGATSVTVEARRLDQMIPLDQKIKLMKIDVEGHELSVFEGAGDLLAQKIISCVLFEELQTDKTESVDFFKKYGYRVFRLNKTFKGPLLTEVQDRRYELSYEPANFIAFADDQLTGRFSRPGYSIYHS